MPHILELDIPADKFAEGVAKFLRNGFRECHSGEFMSRHYRKKVENLICDRCEYKLTDRPFFRYVPYEDELNEDGKPKHTRKSKYYVYAYCAACQRARELPV